MGWIKREVEALGREILEDRAQQSGGVDGETPTGEISRKDAISTGRSELLVGALGCVTAGTLIFGMLTGVAVSSGDGEPFPGDRLSPVPQCSMGPLSPEVSAATRA